MMTTLLAATVPALLAQAGGSLSPLFWWAIAFFVIAIIAYIVGATGVAGMSAAIGRTLLFVFLVIAIILVIVGFATRA